MVASPTLDKHDGLVTLTREQFSMSYYINLLRFTVVKKTMFVCVMIVTGYNDGLVREKEKRSS